MPNVFGSTLTLATFILVVVVACFNSWGHFFFTFFKTLQTLGLGLTLGVALGVVLGVALGVALGLGDCTGLHLDLLCFYED